MQKETTLEITNDPVQEYFVSHVARTEVVEGILMRLYCCKQMGNRLELQYTVLIPLKRLAEMGRQHLRVASEAGGAMTWDDVTIN